MTKSIFSSIFFIVLSSFYLTCNAQDVNSRYLTTQISDVAYIITLNWDNKGKSRSNIGVVVGDDGVLLINTLYTSQVDMLMNEIRKFTKKPVKYVINSNWDFHNTNANAYFKDKGAAIISHENLKYFENTVTQLTFKKQIAIDLGSEVVTAYRSYGHSMGHVNVHLKKSNAIFMSDSFRTQWMTTMGPFGQSGHLKGLDSAIELSDEKTWIIPGNTSSKIYSQKKDLIKAKDIRSSYAKRVMELTRQELSVEEIANDPFIHKLFKDNYDRYSDYKSSIKSTVRALYYDQQLNLKSEFKPTDFLGEYQLPNDKTVEVYLEDGKLFARSEGLFYYYLVPDLKDRFRISWFTKRYFEFVRNGDNEVVGLRLIMDKQDERYGQDKFLKALRKIELVKKSS